MFLQVFSDLNLPGFWFSSVTAVTGITPYRGPLIDEVFKQSIHDFLTGNLL